MAQNDHGYSWFSKLDRRFTSYSDCQEYSWLFFPETHLTLFINDKQYSWLFWDVQNRINKSGSTPRKPFGRLPTWLDVFESFGMIMVGLEASEIVLTSMGASSVNLTTVSNLFRRYQTVQGDHGYFEIVFYKARLFTTYSGYFWEVF